MKYEIILLLIFIFGVFFGSLFKNSVMEKRTDTAYVNGYKTGVQCRGMLSAPSCLLLLERTK